MLYCCAPATGVIVHVHDLAGGRGGGRRRGLASGLAEVVQRRDLDGASAVPTVSAVSFEPAVRAVRVGAAGAARFCEEPAIIWYSSPSIISCSSTKLASAEMSSNPCPWNWASQERDSLRPKNRYFFVTRRH